MGVINKLLGRLKLYSDPAVTTQTTTVIQSDTTNSNLALVPNGTGAIIASVPDGTATGGNARGINSVDLQMSRAGAGQVASSNYAFIGGGQNNYTLSGDHYQVIVGGLSNYINASGHSFIGGGSNNSIFTGGGSGWAVVTGGRSNAANSQYATVSGGQSNTASTNSHATVVGGQSNTSSGQHSVSGGKSNTASGAYSVAFGEVNTASGQYNNILGGRNNVANGSQYCTIGGGSGNQCTHFETTISGGVNNQVNRSGGFIGGGGSNIITASAYGVIIGGYQNLINTGTSSLEYITILGGLQSRGHLFGGVYSAAGMFAAQGDAQQSLLTARKSDTLTTAATTTLSLDGTGTTNLIIPNGNNRAWNVQIDTIAVVTAITGTATGVSVGDCYRETKQLLFKRIGGTSSIVGTVDTTAVKSDTSMSTALLDITAGGSQQMALTFTAPTFSGGGSVTVRVVSKVMLVEVAY